MTNLVAWIIGILATLLVMAIPGPVEEPVDLPTPIPTVTPIPEDVLNAP
jgi:hypothetical protein